MSDLPLPELRTAPPWVMAEMVATEADLAEPIAALVVPAGAIAAAVRTALAAGRAVVVAGCGTSEHAAMAIAEQLGDAARASDLPAEHVCVRQAFEAWLDPWPGGLFIGVSHEAETAATLAAVSAARSSGAVTALVTANAHGPAGAVADHVMVTPLLDRSWCHTVGYLSPLLAGATIAAALRGAATDGRGLAAHLRAVLALREEAERMAAGLASVDRLIVCGSGADRGLARELALKIEEGVRRPAVARDIETQLHGHLVSADGSAGLVVLATDPREAARRTARARGLLAAARRLGMPTAAILREDQASTPDGTPATAIGPELTNAGRLVLPAAPELPPLLASLAGGAVALQLLALGLVHAAGTNPDRIGRERDAQREAAELASASFPA